MSNLLYWRLSRPLYTYLSVRFLCYRPLAPMIRYFHEDKTSDFKKRLQQRMKDNAELKVNEAKEKQEAFTSKTTAESASLSKEHEANPSPNTSQNLYGVEYPIQQNPDSASLTPSSPAIFSQSQDKERDIESNINTFESRAKAFVESKRQKDEETSKNSPKKSMDWISVNSAKKDSQESIEEKSKTFAILKREIESETGLKITAKAEKRLESENESVKVESFNSNDSLKKKAETATLSQINRESTKAEKILESSKDFRSESMKNALKTKPQIHVTSKTKLQKENEENAVSSKSKKSMNMSMNGPKAHNKIELNRIEQLSQSEAEAEAIAEAEQVTEAETKPEMKAKINAEAIAVMKAEVKADAKLQAKTATAAAVAKAKSETKADPAKNETKGIQSHNNPEATPLAENALSSKNKIFNLKNTIGQTESKQSQTLANNNLDTKNKAESKQSRTILDAENNAILMKGAANELSRGEAESSKTVQKRSTFKTDKWNTKHLFKETKSKRESTSLKTENILKPASKSTQSQKEAKSLIKSALEATKNSVKNKETLSKAKVLQDTASNKGVSTKSKSETKSIKVENPLLKKRHTQGELEAKSSTPVKSVLDAKDNAKGSINNKKGLPKAKALQGPSSDDGVSTKSQKETETIKVDKSLPKDKLAQGQRNTKSSVGIKTELETKDKSKTSIKDKGILSKSKTPQNESNKKSVTSKSEARQNKSGSSSNIEKWLSRATQFKANQESARESAWEKIWEATQESAKAENSVSSPKELKDNQEKSFWKKKSAVDLFREAFKRKDPAIQPNEETKPLSPNSPPKNTTSTSSTVIKGSFESNSVKTSSTLDKKVSGDTIKAEAPDLVASGSAVVITTQAQSKHIFSPDSINADFNKSELSLNQTATCDPKPETTYYGFKSPEDIEASAKIANDKKNTVEALLLSKPKVPLKQKQKTFKTRPLTIGDIIIKIRQRSKIDKYKAENMQSLTESSNSREQLEPGKENPTQVSNVGTTIDEFSKKPVSDKTCDHIISNSITTDKIVSTRASEYPSASTDLDQSYFCASQSMGDSGVGKTVTSYPNTQCVASDEIQIHKNTTNEDVTNVGKCVNVDQSNNLDKNKIAERQIDTIFDLNKEPMKPTMSADDLTPGQLYNSKSEGEDRTADMFSVQLESNPYNLSSDDKAELGPKGKELRKLADEKKVQKVSVKEKPKDNKDYTKSGLGNREEKGMEKQTFRSEEKTESETERYTKLLTNVKDDKKQEEEPTILPKPKLSLTQYLYQFLKGQRNNNNDPGRRNITTSAAQCRDKDADDYRLSRRIMKKYSVKPSKVLNTDPFISPDVKNRGMGSEVVRRQRKSTETNPTKIQAKPSRTEKPTLPTTMTINSEPNWSLAINPNSDNATMGSKKAELDGSREDSTVDTTNMSDGSPHKLDDKSPIEKLNAKEDIGNIEIRGGSIHNLVKSKAIKSIGKGSECGKRKFSALGRQLSPNIIFAFFRTNKNSKDKDQSSIPCDNQQQKKPLN